MKGRTLPIAGVILLGSGAFVAHLELKDSEYDLQFFAACWLILGACYAFIDRNELARDLDKSRLKVFEILLLVVGTVFALVELHHNTESNLTSSRGQLYQNDSNIDQEEFDQADALHWTIYTRPETKSAKEYCDELTKAYFSKDGIDGKGNPVDHQIDARKITNASLLYDSFTNLDTIEHPSESVIELRKSDEIITNMLDQMHSAYDYWSDDVIREPELETWIGYLKDIGPNPLVLAMIYHWKECRYMSRNFAEMLQYELTHGTANHSGLTNKAVVDYFYPEMDTPSFLDNLPVYGKTWLTREK